MAEARSDAPLVTVDARMLESSGIGTYLRALLPRLISQLDGVRFRLLGSPEMLARHSFTRAARVECRPLRAGVYSPLEQVEAALASRGTQVFWSPHVNVPLAARGRLLVTVHDAFYLEQARALGTRRDTRLYLGALMRGVQRRASGVLCPSAFTAGELERLLGRFRCPLHVVPNGVDARFFVRAEGDRPTPKPYLLYVGNLKPHKNLPRTLAAFERVSSRIPHDFLLVGGGDPSPLSANLSPALAQRVHFLGPLEEGPLRRHLAHASGLVLASLYEGFGLPPLEAMALGVPALVSKRASLPEVCGDAALYCDPESVDDIAEGIARLLLDEPTRATLSVRGPARAKALDWDASAALTARVIHDLLRR
jgi:glycosyltransferase involved in cell wall biosynthesis